MPTMVCLYFLFDSRGWLTGRREEGTVRMLFENERSDNGFTSGNASRGLVLVSKLNRLKCNGRVDDLVT